MARKKPSSSSPAAKTKPNEEGLPAWTFPYAYELPWDGKPLSGSTIAFDTETTYIPDLSDTIPEVILGSATDGHRHVILRREQLGPFILVHQDRHLVGHNIAFDFWVIEDWLKKENLASARAVLWNMADKQQLHDTMLMDILVRIATGEANSGADDDSDKQRTLRRSLDRVATAYGCFAVEKKNPYRLTFAKLLGETDWSNPTLKGYFDYAIGDPYATLDIWNKLLPRAEKFSKVFQQHFWKNATKDYGLLTEALQTQASIAMRCITLNGIPFNHDRAKDYEASLRNKYNKHLEYLQENHKNLLKLNKDEISYKLAPKSKTPQLNLIELRKLLRELAEKLKLPYVPMSVSKAKTPRPAQVSASRKDWAPYSKQHPFLAAWCGMNEVSKELSFFHPLNEKHEKGKNRVNPSGEVLVRTGRTAFRNPNIQQTPKDQEFRKIFSVANGNKLLTIDYKFIELRTIAAICYQRYGWSKLGDAIKAGLDPHSNGAAGFLGLPYETVDHFVNLPKNHPETKDPLYDKCKKGRSGFKIVIFGLGGGLGDAKLAATAWNTYKVAMTPAEARAYREGITNTIYPEYKLYLGDSTLETLAANLLLPREVVEGHFQKYSRNLGMWLTCLKKVAEGKGFKKDGTAFSQDFQEDLMHSLVTLIQMSDVPEPANYKDLFWASAITPTGRVRAKCRYTQEKNTPFQSLAADGAKVALWNLIREGFKVVGFIHDEVLVELPDTKRLDQMVQRVESIMVSSMEKVLNNLVPAACSYVVADHWVKG